MPRDISQLAKKIRPFFYNIFIFVGLQLVFAYSAYAEDTAPDVTFSGPGDINKKILCPIFGFMFDIALAISVIMFFVSGFKYLTAGGDAEKIKSASKSLTYAFIGTAAALISKGVPLIIGSFLGVSGLSVC